jgi:hypothetical protein
MERGKTKHKGIYKVGDTYYVTYYVGSKKYEKAVGSKLTNAFMEKVERERKGKAWHLRCIGEAGENELQTAS